MEQVAAEAAAACPSVAPRDRRPPPARRAKPAPRLTATSIGMISSRPNPPSFRPSRWTRKAR